MKKRLTVSVDSEVIEVLDQYADMLDVSRSSIVNDMLVDSLPTIKKVLIEFRAFLERTKGEMSEEDLFRLKGQMLGHIVDKLHDDFSE